MLSKIKVLTAAAALAAMTAGSALAGDIEVGGTALNVGVVSGAATNVSTGFLSKAEQSIGAVSGDSNVKIGGDLLNVGVVSGAATNVATGFLSEACQEIGSIGNEC